MNCGCETHTEVCWTQAILTVRPANGGGTIRHDELPDRARVIQESVRYAGKVVITRELRSGSPVRKENIVTCPNEEWFSVWRKGLFLERDETGIPDFTWHRVYETQHIKFVIEKANEEVEKIMEYDETLDWSSDR